MKLHIAIALVTFWLGCGSSSTEGVAGGDGGDAGSDSAVASTDGGLPPPGTSCNANLPCPIATMCVSGSCAPAPAIPTWPSVDLATTADLTGVAYAPGTFVVVGKANTVWTSSDDGATWTAHATASPYSGVTFAASLGKFLAWGGGFVGISQDGVTWDAHKVDRATLSKEVLFGAAYGDGKYVAVGSSDGVSDHFWLSPDALTWTALNTSWVAGRAFVYGAPFVGVGDEGSVSSADGMAWMSGKIPIRGAALVGTASGVFAASQSGGISFSTNGSEWVERARPFGNQTQGDYIYGMGIGLGGAVGAVGFDGHGVILTSPDGNVWSRVETAVASPLNAVAGSSTHWVAVGNHGVLLRSP